jgi:hypothetical protein
LRKLKCEWKRIGQVGKYVKYVKYVKCVKCVKKWKKGVECESGSGKSRCKPRKRAFGGMSSIGGYDGRAAD